MKNSEHYKEAILLLNNEKNKIEKQIEIVTKNLIDALNQESPFKPGDKVLFKNYPDDDWNTGIWGGYELHKYNEPSPTIFKILPDGKQAKNIHWVGSDSEIIPA